MDLGLRGRKALVTGASKGIGRATAEILAEEGCDVVLVSRGEAELAAAADAIRAKHNVRVEAVPADLSISGNVSRLAERHPDIDLLVNNAGAIPGGSLQEIDEARWRAAWDLKVFGYINMCRAYYALMQGRGGGVIVNIIGIGGESLDPAYICGAAGNASLMAFTRCLGSVSSRDNIRVVGINPGPVATERLETLMRKKARDRTGSEDNWRALFDPMPFGRAATPEEIGAMVAMLASDRSAYTSGTIVTIDGGIAGAGRSF